MCQLLQNYICAYIRSLSIHTNTEVSAGKKDGAIKIKTFLASHCGVHNAVRVLTFVAVCQCAVSPLSSSPSLALDVKLTVQLH